MMLKGDQGILSTMLFIEKKHQYSNVSSGLASDLKAYELFRELISAFSPEFMEWTDLISPQSCMYKKLLDLQFIRNNLANTALPVSWQKNEGRCLVQLKNLRVFVTKPEPSPFFEDMVWFNNIENAALFSQVTQLNLSELQLDVLPQEVSACKFLKELQLSGNRFLTFSYDLNVWPLLNTLDLSRNRIQYFSSQLASPNHLESLLLNSNNLQNISCDFEGYTELKAIKLHLNPFSELLCDFTSCKKLQLLTLNTNDIKNFSIQLPSTTSLNIGPITNIVFEGHSFSFPALRASVKFFVPLGYRLGICSNVPVKGGDMKRGFFPFMVTHNGWKGRIPLSLEFKFVLMGSDRRIYLEKRLNCRRVQLMAWNKSESEVFEASDIQF